MKRKFFKSKKSIEIPRFELTPLIDIIFILVLFFAVTSSFVEQKKGIDLILPSAVSIQAATKSIVISIDRNQRVHWNGNRIKESAIQSKVSTLMKDAPDQQIVLQADKNTPYIRVVSILDTIRTSGCYNVMLQAKKS